MPPLPLPPQSLDPPASPESLYDRLRIIDPDVLNLWSHQADALRAYFERHSVTADIAIELPTGSGKTLVGLLIAEWRRQKLGQRVALVAADNLLAAQVVRKARGYGIDVVDLTGSHNDWDDADTTAYRTARSVAITNYNHIFSHPCYVGDAQTLILDDAHAGEGPVASHWSVIAERDKHPNLYEALIEAASGLLPSDFEHDLRDPALDPVERSRTHLLPPPAVSERSELLLEALDEHASFPDRNYFATSVLRGAIGRCLVFVSWREVLIRPLIPPTRAQEAFAHAKQRVYLSATLGSGGELERAFGVTRVERVPVSPAWQRHGAGRRLFLMPGAAGGDVDAVTRAVAMTVPRMVVIAPSTAAVREAADQVVPADAIRLGPEAIATGDLAAFLDPSRAALILANRYNGLDLPNNACRLIVLSGLPTASHAQDRFLWDTLGARAVLSERVRTRITQGAGRATRNRQDFAIVILRDRSLIDFLLRSEERVALRPELQAELELAVHYTSQDGFDYSEAIDAFLHQNEPGDRRWTETEDYVRQRADQLERTSPPGTEALADSATIEVRAWWAAWRGQLDDALGLAQDVISRLGGEELRPYRALWCYLAASWAAIVCDQHDAEDESRLRADQLRSQAVADARGLNWIPEWARSATTPAIEPDARARRAAAYLASLRVGSRRPENEFVRLTDFLATADAMEFEQGLELLGKLLGFVSERPAHEDAAPDAAWRDDQRLWVLWEAKTEELETGTVNANDDVRKANTHITWMQTAAGWSPAPERALTVIVTPKATTHPAASQVASEHLTILGPQEVRDLAARAIGAHRAVRARYPGLSGDALASAMAGEFEQRRLDTASLIALLGARPVRDGL